MKRLLLSWLPGLLLASPALAQRPTAELAQTGASAFWPLDRSTGTVVFRGPTRRPVAPARWQAEHLRGWLSKTCAKWAELQTQLDSTQLYQGELAGVHAGVALRFAVQVRRQPAGWHYQLLAFQVRSPTGHAEVVHWLPLQRLLEDADFRADISSFQQQLQRALPDL